VVVDKGLIRDAYGTWLATFLWTFFLTITFREPCPMRRQESVTHAVGQSIMGRFETTKMLALFAEPHLSQNLHLHGLIKVGPSEGITEAVRGCLEGHLTDRFGWSQATIPHGQSAVSEYVAKYCVKTDGYYELW